jgi:hypothetical protein
MPESWFKRRTPGPAGLREALEVNDAPAGPPRFLQSSANCAKRGWERLKAADRVRSYCA